MQLPFSSQFINSIRNDYPTTVITLIFSTTSEEFHSQREVGQTNRMQGMKMLRSDTSRKLGEEQW